MVGQEALAVYPFRVTPQLIAGQCLMASALALAVHDDGAEAGRQDHEDRDSDSSATILSRKPE